jgi:hypothetical protein
VKIKNIIIPQKFQFQVLATFGHTTTGIDDPHSFLCEPGNGFSKKKFDQDPDY